MVKNSGISDSYNHTSPMENFLDYDHSAAKNRELSLEEIKLIIMPIAAKCNVNHVSLFGSRARGDHNQDSDYDFLIDVGENFSYGDYGLFIEQTTEALGKSVDVVIRSSLKEDDFDMRIRREELNVF